MDCILFVCSLLLLRLCNAEVYTHTWAAHIDGGEEVARILSEKHGFTVLAQIMDNVYHLHHRHVAKRSVVPNSIHHNNLKNEKEVLWLEQQTVKKRVKRDISFNDPKWPKMWYLNRGGGLDMNVQHAWEKGYRGRGVVVSILDDGIEKDNPDLKRNYDAKASYDVNHQDPDPQPRYDYTNENRHGTRCAGEVAAEANNNICSVGVAYEASIGGVRMLDGDVTDAVEAQSLSLRPDHIDIYSASWGPDDDGRTVDGPARLAKQAFQNGIERGRNGKGSIFVWASGNGGRDQDSCNCDGYTNSIYTLSISSATESGHIPWYSEACSSTLSTTYSSGTGKEHQVITTDLRKGCTETHTGTSASAPLAAGIVALALSANPSLTWRDLQHIVVMTSRPSNLKAKDWVENGVGRRVSHSFGFGLMDASAMVDYALNWTNVPEQHRCEIKSKDSPRAISVNGKVSVSVESNGCTGTSNQVLYLEHVQAVVNLTASHRGQVQIYLTSPQGTRSTLLTKRPRDSSTLGFDNWAFMTTHNWGEHSMGTWTLEVENEGATSTLTSWSLIMYGTSTDPLKDQSRQHPRPHSQDCDSESLHVMNAFCVDTCPISFYAVNHSVSSTATTTAATTSHSTEAADTPTPTTPTTKTSLPTTVKNSAPSTATPTSASGSTTGSSTSGRNNQTETSSEQTTYQLECLPCCSGCAKCVGGGENDCLVCMDGYNRTVNGSCEAVEFGIVHYLKSHPSTAFTVVIISLCLVAVMTFFVIFCIMQLMEPDSCIHRKGYRRAPDIESLTKKPGLINGVRYKNGYDKVTSQPLLSSDDSDEDIYNAESKSFNGHS